VLQPYSTRVAVPTGSTVRNVELGLLETVAVNIEVCNIMKRPQAWRCLICKKASISHLMCWHGSKLGCSCSSQEDFQMLLNGPCKENGNLNLAVELNI